LYNIWCVCFEPYHLFATTGKSIEQLACHKTCVISHVGVKDKKNYTN
jgi:hypothetical protein